MKGGEISGNSASSSSSQYSFSRGGGVYIQTGTFTMKGGTIYGSDGGVKANRVAGSTKQGISLFNSGTAQYGDSSSIISGAQTYTDATLTGHD
jgi:hypothetical protein